jgi:hypothetical protein
MAEEAACVEKGLLPVMSCRILDARPARFSVPWPTPVSTVPAVRDMLEVT